MNYIINSIGKAIKSNPVITIAIVIVLSIFIWYFQTKLWNGIGNSIFAVKMTWQDRDLQKDLNDAAVRKIELEQTLGELSEAKRNYDDVKQEKDRLEKIFNDQSKTAAEKVAEFRKTTGADPVRTPTDNLTSESLCARVKAIGASQATIDAVCGR